MIHRLKAAALLCALVVVGGCASSGKYDGTGRCPPKFKVENGRRLAKEVGWFYADFQDFLMGVDYHQDIEDSHGRGPYER